MICCVVILQEDALIEGLLQRVRAQSEFNEDPDMLGLEPGEVVDASDIKDHVIVSGNVWNLDIFIMELRKPVVTAVTLHPVLVVSMRKPYGWETLVDRFKEIYWLRGDMLQPKDFNRSNIKHAYSFTVLAQRPMTLDSRDAGSDDVNIDADTLFAVMKLERYIPQGVFFTVELISSPNIAVLNSTG